MKNRSELCKLFLSFFSKWLTEKPVEPTLSPCGTITIDEASSIILDKMEEMLDEQAEIFLPDKNFKVYKKSDVLKSQALKEISTLKYVKETHDCDDFAAKLFGEFASLVWTNTHALNWFIDEKGVFWFVEPQNCVMSELLDVSWQGNDVRFYLGR